MKYTAIASAITLISSVAFAEPHDFQLQVGSSELDPSIWEGPALPTRSSKPVGFEDSLAAVYALANVDGRQPFQFSGVIEPSGPTRVSLYEAYRDTQEGAPYQDYYDRFPAGYGDSAIAEEAKPGDGDV